MPVVTEPEAKALMAKVIEALGGEDKVLRVQATRRKLSRHCVDFLCFTEEETDIFPDRSISQVWVKSKFGAKLNGIPIYSNTHIIDVVTPCDAFRAVDGRLAESFPHPEFTLNEHKQNILLIAQHAGDPKFGFVLGGTEKIGDIQAKVLNIDAEGYAIRWFVDPQSGRVLRMSYQSVSEGKPQNTVLDYIEWKDIGGLTLPVRLKGERAEKSVEYSIEINPQIDAKLFDRAYATAQSRR